MSRLLEPDVLPDQASLETSHSRLSIVTSLRHRTSRLFGRNVAVTNTADNTPQAIQPRPLKNRHSWFHSVGARFHRRDHTVLESSESSQDFQVELEECPGRINTPSSPETSPPRSPVRRRFFRSRLRLQSLPTKFRRGGTALFRRASSSSFSDEDKENFPVPTRPTARPADTPNTGSWSSFRSGVQRAVREVADGNFRFSDGHGARRAPPRPPARVPLRTLWTITSADSSEGQDSLEMTTSTEPHKTYQLSSPTWSPDWSPISRSNSASLSLSSHSNGTAKHLTHADSTPVASPTSTIHGPNSEKLSHDNISLLEIPVDEENMPLVSQNRSDRKIEEDSMEEPLEGNIKPRAVKEWTRTV